MTLASHQRCHPVQETRTYANPPVVELVIGAQFAPLDKLTAGHFGALWDAVGRSEWVTPSDAQEIEPQHETFESLPWAPISMQLRLTSARGPGRLFLANTANDRLLQIQRTRFHMNWRKRESEYPSYKKLIAEFLETFDRFVLAVNGLGLGQVQLDQWEITYIDAFPKGEYWETPADWP